MAVMVAPRAGSSQGRGQLAAAHIRSLDLSEAETALERLEVQDELTGTSGVARRKEPPGDGPKSPLAFFEARKKVD